MPKLPQALAERTSLGRRAVPRDMGGGEGLAALGQAVGGIGDIAGRLFEEEMSADVSGSVAEANRALNDLSMQVQANPDHNARNKMYADGALKIAREAREGLRYPKFQGMFDERVEGSLERGRVGIAQGVRKAQVDSASANRMKSIETTFDGMANISDPDERGLERDKIYTEIQALVDGGLWSASQGAQFRIEIDNRIAGQELIIESQTRADEIMATYPTAEQRMNAALDVPKGPVRDAVVARIHTRQTEEDGLTAKVAKAQHTALLHRAYADLTQEQLIDESISLSAAGNPLDPQVLKSVAGVIEQRVSGEGGLGEKGPADPYTSYQKLLEMARDPVTRPEFLSLDLSKVADTVLPAQYNKLVANQDKGAWGFTDDTTKRVDRALAKLELPITLAGIAGADTEDRAKAEQFRAVAENALMQAEHRKGSPLTGKETQDTINALFDEVVIDHNTVWAHEKVPLWRIAPATQTGQQPRPVWEAVQKGYIEMGSAGLKVEDVPPAFAAKAREFEGEMTDDEVRERYLEALLRRQAGGPQ